jgi:hypothetical protein
MDYGVLGIGCNLDVWGDMAYEIAMWTNEEGIQFQIVVHNYVSMEIEVFLLCRYKMAQCTLSLHDYKFTTFKPMCK